MAALILLLSCADRTAQLDEIEARIVALEARRAEEAATEAATTAAIDLLEGSVAGMESPTDRPGPRRILPPVSAALTDRCLREVSQSIQVSFLGQFAAFDNLDIDPDSILHASGDCHDDVRVRYPGPSGVGSAEVAIARGPRAGERFVVDSTEVVPAERVPLSQLVAQNGWRPCSR